MTVKLIEVGFMPTNSYILKDEKTGLALMIDPAFCTAQIRNEIAEIKPENIKYILLTHNHYDHIYHLAEVKRLTGAKVAIHKLDAEGLENNKINRSYYHDLGELEKVTPDILIEDSEELQLGNITIKVMHTPGHSKGSCCFIADDVIFSGDTVFKMSVGRTDFAEGSTQDMMNSIKKIKNLSDKNYTILPGHGEPTTLAQEVISNPYFR